MKIASILLAILNTLPLGIYVFVVVPLIQILEKGIESGGSPVSQFCGYGFLWGSLLFPLFLVLNHVFFVKNYTRAAFRPALFNQLYTLAYLGLIGIYAIIAFR